MNKNRLLSILFLTGIVSLLVFESPPVMAIYNCSASGDFKGDADSDGVINGVEDLNANGDCDDDHSDDDGTPDYLDADDDDDGIPTFKEDANGNGDPTDDDYDYSGLGVPNPDGIPNYLDVDSDDDGYVDATERNGSDDPTGGDPITDYDLDGIPDYIDPDSDNDTVLDHNEVDVNTDSGNPDGAHPPGSLNGDLENRRDLDDDGDCILTSQEYNEKVIDPALAGTLRDADGDGAENHIDLDSDNDSYPDVIERGPGLCHLPALDFDDDQANDYLDLDSDDDSVEDVKEIDGNTDAGCDAACISDAFDDRVDDDDDGDSVPTVQEDVEILDGDPGNDDSDDDGIADYLDNDDDNDGIPTYREDPDGNGNPTDDDSDRDEIPDYLDPDSPGPTIFSSGFEYELEVDKRCTPVASPGEDVTYVIEYRTTTGSPQKTVSITDELPAAFNMTSYEHHWNDVHSVNNPAAPPPSINFDFPHLFVDAGPLNYLEGGTLIIHGVVDSDLVSGQVITNRALGAAVSGDGYSRTFPAQCATLIGNADLYMRKSGNPVLPGARVFTFRLVLSNEGVHSATNVEVADILPSNMTYEVDSVQVLTPGWSLSPNSEPYSDDGTTLIWSVGTDNALTMTNGDSGEILGQSGDIEISFLARVSDLTPPASMLENCAQITSDTPEDDNFGNEACVTVTVPD